MGSLATISLLLSPRSTGLKNAVLRGNRRGLYGGLAIIGLLFWLGLFATMYYLVGKFLDVEGIGPFLARKLLEMLLASLFVMLSFSNVITALSTYFLSEDLSLVLSLPLRRVEFHYARFTDTLLQSSWMMALFGVPVFFAYGFRSHAGWSYYAALLVAVPALLVMATNLGITVSTILVNVFPARRTRELMVLLGLVMVVTLFVLLRALRPERLVNAQEFDNAAQYLAQVQVPAPILFPPRWASEVISSTLLYQPFPWVEAGLLVTGALATAAIARWTTAWGFDTGWSRSQDAREARFYRSSGLDTVARLAPRAWQPVVAKELRVFLRDPAQWSQVFLLMGICGIYLVSVQTLPLDAFSGPLLVFMKQAMSFLNVGMGGFVMAAVAARFQFTAVSREGRSWWIVRGAPVNPATLLWAKGVVGAVPMLTVGLVVVIGSGLLLQASPALLLIEGLTTTFLAFGISGIALSMGALWPDFRADNAARAATGPAAVFFMVVAQVLVFVVLALQILAVWLGWSGRVWLAVPVGLLAAGLCIAVGYLPVRRSAEILWAQGL